MTKKLMVLASMLLLFGALAFARNVFKFTFTGETFSDGTQGTIYASIKITKNGEVNVCEYQDTMGQYLGMYQDTAMLFPDNNSVDGGTVEDYCLANFGSRTQ